MNSSNQLKPLFKEWAAKSGTPWCVTFPTRGAVKSKRRFFTSEAEANSEIAKWNNGKVQASLGARVIDEVTYVQALLPGVTLTELARFYLLHHSGLTEATVGTICDSYLEDLRKQKKSEDYQTEQKRLVGQVTAHWAPETLFSSLTKAALITFIKAPETYWNRYARKRVVSVLVSKARELDAIKTNPLEGYKFEDAPKKTPHILKLSDIEAILEHALQHAPELVPSFALQLFAGIRTEELCRNVTGTKRPLRWDDIVFGAKINVPVAVSKTNDDRQIKFWPAALTNWLNAAGTERSGDVCPVAALDESKYKLIRSLNACRKADGLPVVAFEQNDFRRTYTSNAYELHESRVTDWTGHSLKVLKKSYRGFVDHADALAYFESKPSAQHTNVISISA